jgi:hypothetical protein
MKELEDEVVDHESVAGLPGSDPERLHRRPGTRRLVCLPSVSLPLTLRESQVLLDLTGEMTMRKISSRMRIAIGAAAIAAFSLTTLVPTPASARWYPGWGWHGGWHYGWRGCCWGPGIVVGIAPPVVAVAPPVVYAAPPVAPPPGWAPPQ